MAEKVSVRGADSSLNWNRYVIGYHGCDAETADAVIRGDKELHPSKNEYDWLGHGIYFWEESRDRALQWASQKLANSKRPGAKPAVVGAVIELGQCLDLQRPEMMMYLKEAYAKLCQTFETSGRPLPRNSAKRRSLDCAVFDYLKTLLEDEGRQSFQTVRCFFVEGPPVYEGSEIRELNHVQICVMDPSCIVGYFKPRV